LLLCNVVMVVVVVGAFAWSGLDRRSLLLLHSQAEIDVKMKEQLMRKV
jgi:hypothetical protein